MTIENSEDTVRESVSDSAEAPLVEPASGASKPAHDYPGFPPPPATSPGLEGARSPSSLHDSAPPQSRRLAPPPKPKRDSGFTSSPPPDVSNENPDLLAAGASALKAPLAPAISYSAEETLKLKAVSASSELAALAPDASVPTGASAPLSQPPPLRRQSSPVLGQEQEKALAPGGTRAPSDPSLSFASSASSGAQSVVRPPFDTPPQGVSTPPRPVTAAPRPRSDPPPPQHPRSEPAPPRAAPSSVPPSSSAIFAMRIIAVGDSVRPPAVQDHTPDLDPDSYPPSASRLGTSVRRSSRPVIAVAPAAGTALEIPAPAPLPTGVSAPPAAPVPGAAPPEAVATSVAVAPSEAVVIPAAVTTADAVAPSEAVVISATVTASEALVIPTDVTVPDAVIAVSDSVSALAEPAATSTAPELAAARVEPSPSIAAGAAELPSAIEEDIPIDVEPPVVTGSVPPAVMASVPPLVELRPPPPPPPVELGAVPREELRQVLGEELLPEVGEKTEASPEVEELGREDAISVPPEELASPDAEIEAKTEAVKPPPPPKRTTGVLGVAPPSVPVSAEQPKEPPAPDLAAAKAAQRAKTRQPWWEDLFNEDFMRASSRVSDEQISREVTFIEESLGVAAGGVVLDLGCGAGHHAVEFASRGYGVVGYDLSLYQLALAADVAQERSQKINFLQGDMREMAFEEMFDGVFCWNTTFGYFEEDKNLAVAQRVFKALRPGGMFLVDVLNRDFAAASAPCSVWYEGDSCVCMDDMSVDYISSRLRVKRSIILDDGRTKESLYSLRLYSLHELGKLLHEVGFRVTEASGHPATPGVFFGPNSPRIIMLAQRP